MEGNMKKAKHFYLKKMAAVSLGLLLCAAVLGGCGDSGQTAGNPEQTESAAVSSELSPAESTAGPASTEAEREPLSAENPAGPASVEAEREPSPAENPAGSALSEADRDPAVIRVGSLKGPTSLGLLHLMDKVSKGETTDSYEFRMTTGADELLPLMVKGELDIILVPANVAAVLYQKTNGGVEVIDINTLGVLYMVTGTAELNSIADLKGKTVYLTGKGTTPEASLRYLLDTCGLEEKDVSLEFKSEAAEVAAVLAENPDAIGLLPQPFVTAACMQNENLKVALDMNEEWLRVQGEAGNGMVTGVTVARKDFIAENPEAVAAFLEEHEASAAAVNEDPAAGAVLAVEAGIVAKEPIAQKAIPQCNIVCITGEEMKKALSGYLQVLHDFNAELVGGKAPEEDFYYLP